MEAGKNIRSAAGSDNNMMKRRSGDRENRRKGKSLFPASPLPRFSGSRFSVPGFKAAGIACGIKKNNKKDLALIFSEAPATVAGLFTTNKIKAAPVLVDMQRIKKGVCHAVIINSGNANACTGKKGMTAAVKTVTLIEKALGIKKGLAMVSSTGVIGELLPVVNGIEKGIPKLIDALSEEGWDNAAKAIMTTDAFPKIAFEKGKIDGKEVSMLGIAKGAGMICPDMATMLAYIVTDAAVEQNALQNALKNAVNKSFNSITVDGDTSTNDTVLALANGKAGNRPVGSKQYAVSSKDYKTFCGMLEKVCLKLAHMIVRDGEGATKFLEIKVKGAKKEADAKNIALVIANSLLVKTAFFGEDANWGRIMAAIGRAGVDIIGEKISIYFNNTPVVKNGSGTSRDKEADKVIKKKDICLTVDLGMGKAGATVWTTDLTYEYVKINAAYRT